MAKALVNSAGKVLLRNGKVATTDSATCCCAASGPGFCPSILLICNVGGNLDSGANCAAGPESPLEYWFEIPADIPTEDFTLYWSEQTFACDPANDPACVLESSSPFSFLWPANTAASDHFFISGTAPVAEDGTYTEVRVNHDPGLCCPLSITLPTCCWCNPGEGECCAVTPPAEGACCLPNHSCITTTQVDCEDQSGVYQGDDTACSSNLCCPTITAHVHVNFSIDFGDEPFCTASTTEDHDVPLTWLDCDLSTNGEKFDLLIPISPDGSECFVGDAFYEIIAFWDTSTGWDFTFKIHLGASTFTTAPDPPGLGDLETLGTVSQTAFGGTSSVFFTNP